MDKQTCAALLNMLGFDAYDMTYNEWITNMAIRKQELKTNLTKPTFLLKTDITIYAGSLVKNTPKQIMFTSYDEMINHARQINEKNT